MLVLMSCPFSFMMFVNVAERAYYYKSKWGLYYD